MNELTLAFLAGMGTAWGVIVLGNLLAWGIGFLWGYWRYRRGR